jgi:hypothetical protein
MNTSLPRTMPEFAVVLATSGTVAAAWGVCRAILAVRTLRRHHAEPAAPAQVEIVSV